MGNLINPLAFRLATNVYWTSLWVSYVNNNYSYILSSDYLIFAYIKWYMQQNYLTYFGWNIFFSHYRVFRVYNKIIVAFYFKEYHFFEFFFDFFQLFITKKKKHFNSLKLNFNNNKLVHKKAIYKKTNLKSKFNKKDFVLKKNFCKTKKFFIKKYSKNNLQQKQKDYKQFLFFNLFKIIKVLNLVSLNQEVCLRKQLIKKKKKIKTFIVKSFLCIFILFRKKKIFFINNINIQKKLKKLQLFNVLINNVLLLYKKKILNKKLNKFVIYNKLKLIYKIRFYLSRKKFMLARNKYDMLINRYSLLKFKWSIIPVHLQHHMLKKFNVIRLLRKHSYYRTLHTLILFVKNFSSILCYNNFMLQNTFLDLNIIFFKSKYGPYVYIHKSDLFVMRRKNFKFMITFLNFYNSIYLIFSFYNIILNFYISLMYFLNCCMSYSCKNFTLFKYFFFLFNNFIYIILLLILNYIAEYHSFNFYLWSYLDLLLNNVCAFDNLGISLNYSFLFFLAYVVLFFQDMLLISNDYNKNAINRKNKRDYTKKIFLMQNFILSQIQKNIKKKASKIKDGLFFYKRFNLFFNNNIHTFLNNSSLIEILKEKPYHFNFIEQRKRYIYLMLYKFEVFKLYNYYNLYTAMSFVIKRKFFFQFKQKFWSLRLLLIFYINKIRFFYLRIKSMFKFYLLFRRYYFLVSLYRKRVYSLMKFIFLKLILRENYFYNKILVFSYEILYFGYLTAALLVTNIIGNLKLGHSLNRIIYPLMFHLESQKVYYCGWKFGCFGRFQRRGRAKKQWYRQGKFKYSTIFSQIDYNVNIIKLRNGICSIKVYLCRNIRFSYNL